MNETSLLGSLALIWAGSFAWEMNGRLHGAVDRGQRVEEIEASTGKDGVASLV